MKNKRTVKKKLPKYATGTMVTNYMENPMTELTQNQINLAKAQQEANSNPWIMGLQAVGTATQQVGQQIAMSNAKTPGQKNMVSSLGTGLNMLDTLGSLNSFAFGGGISKANVPVEVEGQEVGETPQGQLMQFNGPSHESGGIPVSLPEGTEIYSKRVSIDGKTMAQRKKARENKENRIVKASGDFSDSIAKNTLKRVKTINQKEEELDRSIQAIIARQEQKRNPNQEFASGGQVGKYAYDPTVVGSGLRNDYLNDMYSLNQLKQQFSGQPNYVENMDKLLTPQANQLGIPITADPYSTQPSTMPLNTGTESNPTGKSFTMPEMDKYTTGDVMNIGGNMFSAFAPYFNTMANRAGDTPNVNSYKDFGKDALNKLDQSEQYIAQQRDADLKDLALARNSAISRGRNSARGVNTMRALDLATDQSLNNTQSKVYNQYAQQMMQLLNQQANAENIQDQMVMRGEESRDLADRHDRDNFYSVKGQDLANLGYHVAKTGESVNQVKTRNTTENTLNSQYGHFNYDPYTGKLIGKPNTGSGIDYQTEYPNDLKVALATGEYKNQINLNTGRTFQTEEEYIQYYTDLGLIPPKATQKKKTTKSK